MFPQFHEPKPMKSIRSLAFTLIELLVVMLYLATFQMALDGTTTGDTNLAWPGDQTTPSWSGWSTALVGGGYMKSNDFAKMLSAPGVLRNTNTAVTAATPSALNVFAVAENSDMSTVFLASANYTNGQALNENSRPFGNKGFVVFRKGGDGLVYQRGQATNTSLLPATDFTNRLQ